jgi:predicted nucleic acid-binding protein
MILIDTNVLVALAEPRDERHDNARADFAVLRRPVLIVLPVLIETFYFLKYPIQRQLLRETLQTLRLEYHPTPHDAAFWNDTFVWMNKYGEHFPDAVDAFLVLLSHRDRKLKVWTYDSEFWTVWRRPDGSRIPLVAQSRD